MSTNKQSTPVEMPKPEKATPKSLHCNRPLSGMLARQTKKEDSKLYNNEIITIQVGQCGNQIGNQFWSNITQEHKIDIADGTFNGNSDEVLLDRINVFYTEDKQTSSYKPRSVFVDLDPETMDVLKASPMNNLYKPDNFCFGPCGAGNWWPKGKSCAFQIP